MELRFYNRDGRPIDVDEWSVLRRNHDYTRVAQEFVGDYFVSTVWLGYDATLSYDGTHIIFETMIFDRGKNNADPYDDIYCKRYTNDKDAVIGHDAAVQYAKGLQDGKESDTEHAD